jgi:rare lipoprotein A
MTMPIRQHTHRTHRKPRPRSRSRSLLALAVLALAFPFGAARANNQEGTISWYGAQFHDRPTASGEMFDASALTMAHPTLPFGTKVRVTNLRNGRSVVVTVNDRGPFVGHRIADLSQAAASVLGMIRRGVALARIEVLGDGS